MRAAREFLSIEVTFMVDDVIFNGVFSPRKRQEEKEDQDHLQQSSSIRPGTKIRYSGI